jgi:hypothetical protein
VKAILVFFVVAKQPKEALASTVEKQTGSQKLVMESRNST